MSNVCFTTSWDDGHVADLRVAWMLVQHGLAGTFYIPRAVESGVMSAAEVRRLSDAGLEIGAHTLNHVFLTQVDDHVARAEIDGSKKWVEDATGVACRMFCPPGGKFAARHLEMIGESGFAGVRTVELISLDRPRRRTGGLVEMPTTIQAYPHSAVRYGRNIIRRAAARNLWDYLLCGTGTGRDWSALARALLERAVALGGVFHLWGHSWEIETMGQWDRLDEVLALMAEQVLGGVRCGPNGAICESARGGLRSHHEQEIWRGVVGGVK